jgi:hypothetical protein
VGRHEAGKRHPEKVDLPIAAENVKEAMAKKRSAGKEKGKILLDFSDA